MFRRSQWGSFVASSLVVIALALWLSGCGDSSSPAGSGVTDIDPPGVTSVTSIDVYHIEVLFDEDVDEATSQHSDNYELYRQVILLDSPELSRAPQSYGDTLNIESAALMLDGRTVLLSVSPATQGGAAYRLVVSHVKDLNGNSMLASSTHAFTGSAENDVTPPTIVGRSPAPNETGFGIGQSVMVTFSESMDWDSVRNAFNLTGPGGAVPFEMQSQENSFSFTPVQSLSYGAQYTVSFAANTATDWSNNYLAAASWSFTTTNVPDHTPPTIVSTVPANGAVTVSLNVTLQITFSEAIDPNSLDDNGIMISPDMGDGVPSWSNGGKTLNFDPYYPLLANTTYTLIAIEGMIKDLAGNGLAESYTLTFSTGSTLPSGQFSGTLSGDPSSTQAADPEGALIAACLVNLFFNMNNDGPPPIAGTATADQNGDYQIRYLGNDTYYPFAIMDSNNDSELNPDQGDAMGFYGIDFTAIFTEEDFDSVVIAGGYPVTGVDFALYDPVAISGHVSYNGSIYGGSLDQYPCYVGLFVASTFDTTGGLPNPDYSDETNLSSYPEYTFHEFDGLEEGTYYVGAFLDVNYNHEYDPGIDPAGFYADGGTWATVTVENGEDGVGVDISLDDPEAGTPIPVSSAQTWVTSGAQHPAVNPALQRALHLATKLAEQQRAAR